MSNDDVQNDVLTDRVEMMRGKIKEDEGNKINWQMVGVISCTVIFFGGFVLYQIGGSNASTNTYLPAAAITDDDPLKSKGALFGDTKPIPTIPKGPSVEVLELQDQIEALRNALEAAKSDNKMPAAFTAEMKKMQDEMKAMQASYNAKTDSYEKYIAELESKFAIESRLPSRPVSLQDSKWERAQQLNVIDDTGEAARIAAPSMVFDGTQRNNAAAKEDNEDEQLIIQQFGTTFPTSEELTYRPQ